MYSKLLNNLGFVRHFKIINKYLEIPYFQNYVQIFELPI